MDAVQAFLAGTTRNEQGDEMEVSAATGATSSLSFSGIRNQVESGIITDREGGPHPFFSSLRELSGSQPILVDSTRRTELGRASNTASEPSVGTEASHVRLGSLAAIDLQVRHQYIQKIEFNLRSCVGYNDLWSLQIQSFLSTCNLYARVWTWAGVDMYHVIPVLLRLRDDWYRFYWSGKKWKVSWVSWWIFRKRRDTFESSEVRTFRTGICTCWIPIVNSTKLAKECPLKILLPR